MTLDVHERLYGHLYDPLQTGPREVTCVLCFTDQQEEENMRDSSNTYDPHIHDGSFRYHDHHDENEQPERSRVVAGEEYMTVAEYLRRLEPAQYPIVDELILSSGVDRTYQTLGRMAADEGRRKGVTPVKLYHPSYDEVNGWPYRVIQPAWINFWHKFHGSMRWEDRDPEYPAIPEPVKMPVSFYDSKIAAQVRQALQRRGKELPAAKDPRWRGAFHVLLEQRDGETPEQALVRRTSAAGAMFAIEKEYEKR